jgi:hypothetical protein
VSDENEVVHFWDLRYEVDQASQRYADLLADRNRLQATVERTEREWLVSDDDEVLRGLHIDDLIALITVLRRDYAAATVAADTAAEAVGNMADYVSQIVAERDRLREALALAYFHLGPPQPRLTDHAEVPRLVEQAMAERDRLRAVADAARAYIGLLDETRVTAQDRQVGLVNLRRELRQLDVSPTKGGQTDG